MHFSLFSYCRIKKRLYVCSVKQLNIYTMTTVTLQMIDELTGKQVSRTIDITNAMSNGQYCWELRGENEQRKSLNNWILERGNEQHATILTLISWSFN